MRLRWPDDTAVNVHFWSKGAAKSQVQLQHRGWPDKAAADRAREQWAERLAALARMPDQTQGQALRLATYTIGTIGSFWLMELHLVATVGQLRTTQGIA